MSVAFFVPPEFNYPGGQQTALVIVRWIHFVAGITWVGLLYFFNLVNLPLQKELDQAARRVVVLKVMPRALWWFRWSSVVTVLAGIAYWNHIVATEARNAIALGREASAGTMIGSFFVIWTLAFFVEMGCVMSPPAVLKSGPVLGTIVGVVVIAASYVFVGMNQHGWESSRSLAIGVGGGLGWFMMFNVWGIVWRIQKKLIRWTQASAENGSAMPPEAAALANVARVVTRVNFWLSFPMLFFMGAASHYLLFAA